jgi:hypothetical protein
MAAGNAVGGHRTLNKTDHLFCRSITEHSPCAWAGELAFRQGQNRAALLIGRTVRQVASFPVNAAARRGS